MWWHRLRILSRRFGVVGLAIKIDHHLIVQLRSLYMVISQDDNDDDDDDVDEGVDGFDGGDDCYWHSYNYYDYTIATSAIVDNIVAPIVTTIAIALVGTATTVATVTACHHRCRRNFRYE